MLKTRNLTVILAGLLLLGLGTAFVAVGQATDATEGFRERIEVRVLNLEAVVSDRDGVRVPKLGPSDFRLLVDGEEMPIQYFTEVREGQVVSSDKGVPALTSGQTAPVHFLIFIDEFFAIDRDKKQVLNALRERVPNLRPEDRVAVTAWNGKSLDVLTDWTGSQEAILKTLDEALARPGQGLQREVERRQFNVTTRPEDMALAARRNAYDPFHLGTQERMYAGRLLDQLRGVVGASAASMRGLELPAGRKVLLMLAGGWPMDVTNWVGRSMSGAKYESGIPSGVELYGPISKVANLLGYTIYPVDLPGIQATSGADASRRLPTPAPVLSTEFYMEGEIHDSLAFLAADTGGLPFINGQRITAFGEVGQDVRSYYWLGFSPDWAKDDERHEIRVEVTNPDLRVRSRTGYFDISPQTQVALSVQSSLLLTPGQASSELQVELGEFGKAGRGKMTAPVTVTLPAQSVTAVRTDDGYVVQLDLFIAALDSEGGRSDTPSVPLAYLINRKPRSNDVIRYQTDITVRRKTTTLSVAVYDRHGGKTFTRTLAVEG